MANIDDKDAGRGIYEKYRVERTDGRSEPGEKHHGCRYFVLDLNHDPHVVPALRAYAKSCGGDYPELASDLRYAAEQIERGLGTPDGVDHHVGFRPSTWSSPEPETDAD